MSKPASVIRSKAMSAIAVGIKLSTMGSVLVATQASCVGTHAARSYRWDKPSRPKIIEIGHSPVLDLLPNHVCTGFQIFCRTVRGRDLLWTWNPMLVTHTVITSVTTTLFPFQIAMLVASMRTRFLEIATIWNRRWRHTCEEQSIAKQ